jgi:hypothetical protein
MNKLKRPPVPMGSSFTASVGLLSIFFCHQLGREVIIDKPLLSFEVFNTNKW